MRNIKMLRGVFIVFIAIIWWTYALPAEAQESFPTKPITIMIPFAAGGSPDTSTRNIVPYATKYLGTSIFIENVVGADGLICYNKIYSCKPDGYTLFAGNVLALIVREYSAQQVKYKAAEFVPIFAFTRETSLLVVHPGLCKTFEEFMEVGKTRSIKIGTTSKYGTSGGLGFILEDRMGMKFTWIPFDSGGESLAAMAGGHIDAVITTIASARGLAATGKIKPLLMFSNKRNSMYPDVPIPGELRLDIPLLYNQVGIMGPPGMDENRRKILEGAFAKAAENPEYVKMQTSKFPTTDLIPLSSGEFKKEFERVSNGMEKYKAYFR